MYGDYARNQHDQKFTQGTTNFHMNRQQATQFDI